MFPYVVRMADRREREREKEWKERESEGDDSEFREKMFRKNIVEKKGIYFTSFSIFSPRLLLFISYRTCFCVWLDFMCIYIHISFLSILLLLLSLPQILSTFYSFPSPSLSILLRLSTGYITTKPFSIIFQFPIKSTLVSSFLLLFDAFHSQIKTYFLWRRRERTKGRNWYE